jgi:hypothetical protein
MESLAKKTKPVLVVDQIVCPLDDGRFRLVQEDTLDAIANDVRFLHTKSVAGGQQQILCAFLCGVALARARAKLPKAKRGPQADGQGGFDNWTQTQFPEINRRTLYRYAEFVDAVYLHIKHLHKSDTVSLLSKSPLDFQFNPDKARELLSVIGTAMDGKSMTELVRSQKIIREALCSGGDTGVHTPRRTKAEVEQEAAEADAATSAEILNEIADAWLDDKRYLRLNDLDLQLVRERLIELESAISALANDRRLKRLPDNWRLTEIAR